ncbi:hypothetical protein HK413_05170 [Mucilaginibacter sp. S1162]|uniref:Uncharacterized protein n=1 Tax=Mucilaginibacter humi TaxID=2732510 RepID=A0ABX1W0G5_9SPHI|nr:hypothetical protein [Mucilaginibacter humi]NNU33688.1 hypothetical protein [Mucilaginibacter humi]
MRDIEPPFEIRYKGSLSKVTEAAIKNRRVFHIKFNDGNAPLTITVTQDKKEVKFWTSIPEGRQEEAEEVGKLIAVYIRDKKIRPYVLLQRTKSDPSGVY